MTSKAPLLGYLPRTLRWLEILLIAGVVILTLEHLHVFFSFAGTAPYVSIDDTMANVIFNFSRTGYIGYPASPIQPYSETYRLDSFVNYGPWYFWLGGVLSWIFGFSLELVRAIHPIGIGIIALLSFVAFRRDAIGVAGLFSVGVWLFFFHLHWPMVRPDIMVSVFTIMAVVFLSRAMDHGGFLYWCGAGFAATSAFWSHQIAWPIIMGTGFAWIFWAFFRSVEAENEPRSLQIPMKAMIALIAGGLIAILFELIAIRFQVNDLVRLWFAIYQEDRTIVQDSYLTILMRHHDAAWSGVPIKFRYPLFLGVATGLVLMITSIWIKSWRPVVLSRVLPPLCLGGAYILGIGTYHNFHAGYVILIPIITLWAASASLIAVILLINQYRPIAGEFARAAVLVLGLAITLQQVATIPFASSNWIESAKQWVDFNSYNERVVGSMPKGARAWGTVIFAMKAPVQNNLIQLGEGMRLAERIIPENRKGLEPNFLVLGYTILKDAALIPMRGKMPAKLYDLAEVWRLFPDERYTLFKIVNAPPYGTTRIYRRVTPSTPVSDAPPSVTTNDGGSSSWSDDMEKMDTIPFAETAPVTFEYDYGVPFKTKASKSVMGNLQAGTFLVQIRRAPTAVGSGGLYVATSVPNFSLSGSELGVGLNPAPYFGYEESVSIFVDHAGGPLYLSHYGKCQKTCFEKIEVWRVVDFDRRMAKDRKRQQLSKAPALQLPRFTAWKSNSGKGVKVKITDEGQMQVKGEPSPYGYQVWTPPISVPPGRIVHLKLPVVTEEGSVGTGILDENGFWLVLPKVGVREIIFRTHANREITIVIAANKSAKSPVIPRFRIGQGSYWLETVQKPYSRQLIETIRSQK